MEKFKPGVPVISKAGHDAGKFYIIIEVKDAYVYLADGRIRTLEHLKKKKKKHVQIINREHDITGLDDVGIKRILKEYEKV
ncbi:RNA-binding protein [Sporofaciens sp. SGI.106]|uniref:RNA-binding protein n=1 Tax=Sporofaciens sp. SGI.106 TaxID=3420568 RepID=UPI003D02361D